MNAATEKAKGDIKRRLRCAVYTRKSTTEGLEQEFNSLDAQREACEKFVQSQKGEGWVLSPTVYDDGGFTGGNTDRPGLQKLLADIRTGQVDVVVVYKVDRLSRSLLDFTKIIELFEKNGVAFVSVTQQFNTNSSMGRLTLNVLLSFAQFEREIISERIKDKMRAARRRGKWVGGTPPLGYDIDREKKRAVVNPEEAKVVRLIFSLYLEKKSILDVVRELNRQGLTSKHRISRAGRESGGAVFQVTNVQKILTNTFYLGKTVVGEELFPGEHEAILTEEVFRAAEKLRQENQRHSRPKQKGTEAFLKGLLQCRSCGCPMTHTYAQKNGKRYRYYICAKALKQGYDSCPDPTVNAQVMEDAACNCLKKVVEESKGAHGALKDFFAFTWDALFPAERGRIFRSVLERLYYHGKTGTLSLALNDGGLRNLAEEIAMPKAEVV